MGAKKNRRQEKIRGRKSQTNTELTNNASLNLSGQTENTFLYKYIVRDILEANSSWKIITCTVFITLFAL